MRMLERLDELYAIGGGPGANRPHPGAGEDEAHELAAEWMRQAGLDVEVDPSGNLLGHAAERQDVWVGSHLDTVPQGGRFDGALGVIAGLEAVERTGRGTVVSFRGEEVGCVGSRARCAGSGPLPTAFLELHVEQGPVLGERRCSARRRHEHRRLRARRACVRRRGRACRDHADERSAGRARRCGGGDPADQGRGALDRGCRRDGRSDLCRAGR